MQIDSDNLEPNEFAFHLKTNDVVSPQSAGMFLAELGRIARLKSHFGPAAEVRVLEIGIGSFWGKIAIGIGIGGGLAGMGSFVLDLEERLHQPRSKLGQCVAEMAIDSSVVEAKVVTREKTIEIRTADMPAVAYVEERRALASAKNETSENRRLAFEGKPLTFDNNYLTFDEVSKDYPQIPGPIASKGGITFGGQARASSPEYFVGKLHTAYLGDADARLEGASGTMFRIKFGSEMSRIGMPWGKQVVVRAVRDSEERDLLRAFEVSRLTDI